MSKTVVITGGNSGIGLATAHELARRGARVCLACRDQAKAQAARTEILAAVPGAQVEVYKLDLASFDAIRRFVADFSAAHDRLDVLVNNAGAVPLKQQKSADGFELQFGANYLGPVLLTHLLLPLMEKAVTVDGEARIVHLASIAHNLGRIDPATFRGRARYNPLAAYAQSKLGNLMFSNALASRLPAGITTQALHPGGVDSPIYRELPRAVYAVMRLFLISPQRAARLVADLSLAPQWKGRSGGYETVQWPKPVSRHARSKAEQEALYDTSCKLLGLAPLPARR